MRSLRQKVKNALSDASEADVVFNPYVASVMLDKVTELQKSKNQSNYESIASETKELNGSVNKLEKKKRLIT